MPFLLDKIILSLLVIFFIIGWFRGFLRSLIGPLSFFICTFFAVLFYDLNRNILAASLITIIGSITLAIFLSTLLTIGMATVNKDFRGKVFLGSRITGSIINLAWNGNALFIIMLILMLIPAANGSKLERLQEQAKDSTTIKYYYQHIFSQELRAKAVFITLANLYDPDVRDRIRNMAEYKSLEREPKFQQFINDPTVIEAIETKDAWKMIKSPALKTFIANDRAMETFTLLARNLYRQSLHEVGYVPPPKPDIEL